MKTILSILLLAAMPLAAQAPALQEKVDVNLVLVDVTVTDRKGNQILGLDKNDFVIREGDDEQKVDSVDYFTNRRLLDSPESKAAFKVERVREERNFIFFFHKPLDPSFAPDFRSELLRARRAAEEFVDEKMLPKDRVAIAGFDARLKIFTDLTSDKNAVKRAIEEVGTFSDGIKQGNTPILAEIDPKKMMNKTGTAYDAIRMLADSVDQILGRKVLVLFSPGIGEPQLFDNAQDEQRYIRPMIEALNRANVTVYSAGMKVPITTLEDILSRMAIETGGEFFRNPVSYNIPLKEMEKDNSGYYLVSYYSRKPKDKHGYQHIDVAVRNPEFRVKAREGYPY